eukprot:6200864-Pleurochrysis_carterae.AAC.3
MRLAVQTSPMLGPSAAWTSLPYGSPACARGTGLGPSSSRRYARECASWPRRAKRRLDLRQSDCSLHDRVDSSGKHA